MHLEIIEGESAKDDKWVGQSRRPRPRRVAPAPPQGPCHRGRQGKWRDLMNFRSFLISSQPSWIDKNKPPCRCSGKSLTEYPSSRKAAAIDLVPVLGKPAQIIFIGRLKESYVAFITIDRACKKIIVVVLNKSVHCTSARRPHVIVSVFV